MIIIGLFELYKYHTTINNKCQSLYITTITKLLILPIKKLPSNNLLLEGHRGELLTGKFSPNGFLYASGGYDRKLFIWDIFNYNNNNSNSQNNINNYILKYKNSTTNNLSSTSHNNSITDLAFTKDSLKLVSCGADKNSPLYGISILVLELRKLCKANNTYNCNNSNLMSTVMHSGIINSVDTTNSSNSSKYNDLVVSGGDDGKIIMYDLNTNKPVYEYIHKYVITCVKFDANNNGIYFGGIDNKIHYFNIRQQEIEYSLVGHTDSITGLGNNNSSNSNNLLVSFGMDNKCILWNASSYVKGNSRLINTYEGAINSFEKNLIKPCIGKL